MVTTRLQARQRDTSLATCLDARWSNALYRAGAHMPRWVWRAFEFSGDGLVWLALTLAVLLAPSTPPALRTTWTNFLLGWAADLVLVGGLKAVARRARPVYNVAQDFVVVVAVDHFSFPSGHSSRASFVALFTAVCLAHSHPGACCAVAAWALALALSRAAMGRHYLSDVAAGLAVGVATTGIVTQWQYAAHGFWLQQPAVEAAYTAAMRRWGRLAATLAAW